MYNTIRIHRGITSPCIGLTAVENPYVDVQDGGRVLGTGTSFRSEIRLVCCCISVAIEENLVAFQFVTAIGLESDALFALESISLSL